MMGVSLTHRFDGDYEWGGLKLTLDMSFDNILLVYEMLEDRYLGTIDKLLLAVELLVLDDEELSDYGDQELIQLALDLFRDCLDRDLRGGEDKEAESDENSINTPVYDWNEDAELIYASFLFDYNIDLYEAQGSLHWSRFLALFKNLSDKSPFGIAVHYRTCDVPKPDSHNKEERDHILKMKRKHALKSEKAMQAQAEAAHQHALAFAASIANQKGR
ncbi:Gp15 family bacteriophage protein [Halobacillus sp. Cin3]|uniref:Gp15 family bacteriophage protein n=1 Tax=Halobacillus sp. Cin3 TaxID=2928441 RepID=UPI00248EC087|nr:Gp15 family bacteriophage protein [Halobacillus sp. Cin3]